MPDQPPFSIESPKQLIDVHQFGLDLDHEQVRDSCMPGKLIYHTTLAVDSKGHLRLDQPARSLHDEGGNSFRQQRMPTVQEPIEVAAPPPSREVHANVQRGSDSPDCHQRQAPTVAPLYERNRGVRYTGGIGKILLAELAWSRTALMTAPSRWSSMPGFWGGRLHWPLSGGLVLALVRSTGPAQASAGQPQPRSVSAGIGGATGTRTLDLLHAMQALFQLSYSPTRTRMLHEPDGLACDLIGRPKDRPDRVQSTTLGALRRYA